MEEVLSENEKIGATCSILDEFQYLEFNNIINTTSCNMDYLSLVNTRGRLFY